MPQAAINPRKIPRQSRSEATVAAILQAAARILAQDGLDRMNTNRVAELAGVSIGTLYQYFPNKDAILTQILRQKREVMLAELTTAIGDMQRESLDQTLDKLLRAAIAHQLKWPRLARVLEYVEVVLPLQQETDDLNAAIIDRVTSFLRFHQIADPQQCAIDLVAALRGMIDAAGMAGETDQDAVFRRAQRMARGYIAGPRD